MTPNKTPSRSLYWLLFVAVVLVVAAVVYGLTSWGRSLETVPAEAPQTVYLAHVDPSQAMDQPVATTGLSGWEAIREAVWHQISHPFALLLLQLISILLVARLMGQLFNRLGQPTVIGEIVAGILLGPSVLGYLWPDFFQGLFPAESLNNIYYLSQVGLVLFMFVIGMELNMSSLKDKLQATFIISQSGIFFPFVLGMLLAIFLYRDFAAQQTAYLPFALFIGISMSITAFPVLARIIQEKDLTCTHLGSISLGSAAIGDVTAWCLLAAVIAISKTGSLMNSLVTLLLTILYVLGMVFVVKPFLKRLGEHYKTDEVVNKSTMAYLILLLLISSFITESLGIHALFGAFMAGVVMPPMTNFRRIIIDKVEDVSVSLLLPLFFVFTGLRTEIGLLNTPELWGVCGLIVLVAIVGKFGGTAIPARLFGESTQDSLSMGVLMNTRGLMELIVLNIGYEMGVLPPALFVMLVIMALVTTFMATPALSLIERLYPNRSKQEEFRQRHRHGIFKSLVAVGNPENGKVLLNVAKSVLDGSKNSLAVNVLHITEGTDINMFSGDHYIEESFNEVREEAEALGIPIETEYKVTDNVSHEIVYTTNYGQYDFLLVGGGVTLAAPRTPGRFSLERLPLVGRVFRTINEQQMFYPSSLIKDKTRYFIENTQCSVGVFVNRQFSSIKKTLVVLVEENDLFLLRYGRRLLRNNPVATLRIRDINGLLVSNEAFSVGVLNLMKEFPDRVQLCKETLMDKAYMDTFSFMMISYPSWNLLTARNDASLEHIPSTLIINKRTSRFHTPA